MHDSLLVVTAAPCVSLYVLSDGTIISYYSTFVERLTYRWSLCVELPFLTDCFAFILATHCVLSNVPGTSCISQYVRLSVEYQ